MGVGSGQFSAGSLALERVWSPKPFPSLRYWSSRKARYPERILRYVTGPMVQKAPENYFSVRRGKGAVRDFGYVVQR